jgi:hemerythrin-like domain-containing protein
MTRNGEPLADIRDMYVIHTVFRRELGLAADLVRGVAVGDDERSSVVSDHVELILSLLRIHHSGEDAHIWPKLLERVPQDSAPIVHTMESQHHGIEAAGTEVATRLGTWRSSAAAEPGEQLAAALERLNLAIREHLSLEEEKALPLIGAHITAAEWNAMVQQDGADAPPEMLPLIFGMSMYEGDPEAVQMVVDSMPPDLRAVIKDVAAQAYADHAKKVYGTATPPRIGT